MVKLYKLLYIFWSLKNRENRKLFLLMLFECMNNIVERFEFLASPSETPYTEDALRSSRDAKVLLVVHEFSRTGVPYATLYLARALFTLHGIRPVILSAKDGAIRQEFIQEGFLTIVDPLLLSYQDYSADACQFIARFETVIVSSLASFKFIRYFRGIAKNLTWWIHETNAGFESAIKMNADLSLLFAACDALWLGSPLCFPLALQYTTEDKLHLLLYGCTDTAMPHRPHTSGKMVFSIVGSLDARKGQDVFLAAIQRLPEELRRKAIFRLIGSPIPLPYDAPNVFCQKLLATAATMPEVELIDNIPASDLLAVYAETDVLVSASRDDPMPIVATQGLMFSAVCVCSSAIGHAKLLTDGKDGLIFTNESAEELSEKMAWLLQNTDNLAVLGKAGRQLYEKYFLMSSFVNNLKNLL